MLRRTVVALVLAGTFGGLALADASKGAAVFATGQTLLEKGDFKGALDAFREAAREDPQNAEYRSQALLVFRVIKLRDGLGKIEDDAKWSTTAFSLHNYYVENGINGEALASAESIHARLKTADSAALLARTRIDAGKAEDAVKVLDSMEAEKVTPDIQVLRGIALARLEREEAARELAKSIELPEQLDAQLACDAARLHALLGDNETALRLLKTYFEGTRPSRLDVARTSVRQCADFARLADTEPFGSVLKTESKVSESDCSGGSSCGSCPSAASCGKSGSGEHKK